MQTTESDRQTPRLYPAAPVLLLLFSGGAPVLERGVGAGVGPRRLVLRPGVTRIGRAVLGRQDLALSADTLASREHARIEISVDGAPVLFDGGSKNGTFVNGRRVRDHALRDGDVLRVGGSVLLLRHDPAPLRDADVPSLLGEAPATRELRARLAQAAGRRAPVLLQGESGTGKDLAARALHALDAAGGRRGPWVPIRCAAISSGPAGPAGPAERQLFGHVTGAVAGAKAAQPGLLQSAEGGTAFLDEIGELPLPLQARLLRMIEDRVIWPVGAAAPRPCDVRLVAATSRDLRGDVGSAQRSGAPFIGSAQRSGAPFIERGRFREDVLARLSGHVIRLPPLRERAEDILPLLLHLWDGPPPQLTPALAELLVLHRWPFNVRELTELVAGLVAEPRQGVLDVPQVLERLRAADRRAGAEGAEPPTLESGTCEDEALSPETLRRLLGEHRGVISRVAEALTLSRRQVRRLMEQYGLRREDFI